MIYTMKYFCFLIILYCSLPCVIGIFDELPAHAVSRIENGRLLQNPTNIVTLALLSSRDVILYLLELLARSDDRSRQKDALWDLIRQTTDERFAPFWTVLSEGFPNFSAVIDTGEVSRYLMDRCLLSFLYFVIVCRGVDLTGLDGGRLLVFAVEHVMTEVFLALLNKGVDLKVLEKDTPVAFVLIDADTRLVTRQGYKHTFVELVAEHDPSVLDDSHRNEKGQTPLLYCLAQGFEPDVKTIAKIGASWQEKDAAGMDALETAIRGTACTRSTLELVCESVENPKLIYDHGMTFYHIWSETMRGDELEVLAKHFPDVDINQKDELGRTPLEYAEQKVNVRAVRVLLMMEKASLGNLSQRALGLLLASSNDEVFLMRLLKKGFDVDHIFEDGMTPLAIAIMAANYSAVSVFCELTTLHNKQLPNGKTAFLMAASCENDRILARLGVHPEVDVNCVSSFGLSALEIAIQDKRPLNVSVLLYEVPRFKLFHHTHIPGYDIVLFAAGSSYDVVRRMVQSKRYDFTVVDPDGRNVIHYAVQERETLVLKYLLTLKGVNPDLHSPAFGTPMSLAMQSNNLNIQYVLVKRLMREPNISSTTKAQIIAVNQLITIAREMSGGGANIWRAKE